MNKRDKGQLGEKRAVIFLKEKGYEILARNFRSKNGEIDVIAQIDKQVIFIEVKSWDSLPVESLGYAIGAEKQRRILATSKYFVHKNPCFQDFSMRFDVIFVHEHFTRLEHIENAFNGV